MSKSAWINVFYGIALVVAVYGNVQAEEMTPALRKDVYNKIVQDCGAARRPNAANSGMRNRAGIGQYTTD